MKYAEPTPSGSGAGAGAGTAEVKILGPFRLIGPKGVALAIPTKKNRALLAILALSPGGQATRERLCGLLWGDRADEQARSSLRQSLAVLRKELDTATGVLSAEDDRIDLDLKAIAVDALEFLACARSQNREDLVRAALLYQGDLLADATLKDEAFEDWLGAERRRFQDIAILLFERLAGLGTSADRIAHAKRLVAFDPFREASHRSLMQAYQAAGETGHALQQFESCKAILNSEFGVSPAQETVGLRDAIAKGLTTKLTQFKDDVPVPVTPEERPSIAVLPFTNLSGDPQQQYFGDGISEDITTGLSRFRSLAVVARNSAFRFRGDVDIAEAGRALGTQYIVEGSIKRLGPRLRITAQLVETATAKHLWAENYDVTESDFFVVQDEVVQTITATLVGRVAEAGVFHARLKPPGSLAAYELVLRANALSWETREAKSEARRLLESALQLDPQYATAHALLAAVALREAAYHGDLTRDVLDRAAVHARRAADCDPNDSTCHSILGWVLIARRESDLAGEHISRALQLNPNNPFAFVNRGSLQVQLGKPDEAIVSFAQAQRTDPFFNPSWVQEKFAVAHFTARRYEVSANHLARAAKPRFYMHALAAASLQKLGSQDAAREALGRALTIRPDLRVDHMLQLIPYTNEVDELHLREALKATGMITART